MVRVNKRKNLYFTLDKKLLVFKMNAMMPRIKITIHVSEFPFVAKLAYLNN